MSEQDEIVEVKGVPLVVKGGDRDITVKVSELEYCITSIRKLKEHKASLMLEQIVARGSTPPAAAVTVERCARLIEENVIKDTISGKVLSPRQAGNRDGLHYATAIRALSASPSPVESREMIERLVKPFDLTRLLRHAFDAGKDGGLWVDYDPTELAPYLRIDAAIAAVNHAALSPPSSAVAEHLDGDLPQSPWPASEWAIKTIDQLRATLRWVKANYASGSTREINSRIDAALSDRETSDV